MIQHAEVNGTVAYRDGDGPSVEIRPGPVDVEDLGDTVNLTWHDDEGDHSQALPKAIFAQYVKNRDLTVLA
jgi:hypothetical protein